MLKKLLISLCTLLPFISNANAVDWIEGAIYTTPYEKGYTLIKVLKTDKGGVHIRMYSNFFEEKPSKVNEDDLFMAGMDRDMNTPLGMGHSPISYSSIKTWGAEFLQQSTVHNEELEGYKMWKDAQGGYF